MSFGGVNKLILVGEVVTDVAHAAFGKALHATFKVGTIRTWTDQATMTEKSESEVHAVIAYNRLAEIAIDYVTPGRKVYIEAYLKTNKWADNKNVIHSDLQIIATNMQLLDSIPKGEYKPKPKYTTAVVPAPDLYSPEKLEVGDESEFPF